MEPQAIPQPQTPSIPPAPPTPQIKSSLLIIMSVLLIIATALAGLFYFQIQKLSKELSKYQVGASPTPLVSPETSMEEETEKGVCKATYEAAETPELSAEQNYSLECSLQRNESDCLKVDIYNLAKKDFSTPDGISDCKWTKSNLSPIPTPTSSQ
jgi:uncharacterized protein HemX